MALDALPVGIACAACSVVNQAVHVNAFSGNPYVYSCASVAPGMVVTYKVGLPSQPCVQHAKRRRHRVAELTLFCPRPFHRVPTTPQCTTSDQDNYYCNLGGPPGGCLGATGANTGCNVPVPDGTFTGAFLVTPGTTGKYSLSIYNDNHVETADITFSFQVLSPGMYRAAVGVAHERLGP